MKILRISHTSSISDRLIADSPKKDVVDWSLQSRMPRQTTSYKLSPLQKGIVVSRITHVTRK